MSLSRRAFFGAVAGWAACAAAAETHETPAPSAQEFDCHYGKGTGDWQTSWSAAEKAWCCKHKGLGCHADTAEVDFNCNAGLENWAIGWSDVKKAYCCTSTGTGCEEPPSGAGEARRHSSEKAAVVDPAVLVATAAEAKSCGVNSVRADDGFFENSKSLQPVCERMMTTNCSVSYSNMHCPSDCHFLVPDHHFVCAFSCVPAHKCSSANANRAFPDPVTGMCTDCQVEACKLCDSVDRCVECHGGFELSEDGKFCTFGVDRSTHPQKVIDGLLYVIVALVVLGCAWRLLYGNHPNIELNTASINRARLHRHLCKVQDWTMFNNKKVRERYPLSAQVHHQHIVGVGLPLFYNSICFLAVVSLLCYGCTYFVFSRSPIASALAAPADFMSMASLAAPVPSQAPAMVLSPLAACSGGGSSAKMIISNIKEFANSNFFAIGFLYVSIFLASFAHVVHQQRSSARFDARNKTMSDFALRITGLKRDITDEPKLTARLQEAFRKASPRAEGQEPIEVLGVSICYDYSKVWGEVDSMRDRLLERMELDMEMKVQKLAKSEENAFLRSRPKLAVENTSFGSVEAMRKQADQDREQAHRWFDDRSEERLKSTGDAFVIFKKMSDKVDAWAVREKAIKELESVTGSNSEIQFAQVYSEPPSVNWWHLAVTGPEVKRNVQWAMVKILSIIALVQLCIVVPFAYTIVWPYSKAGSQAGGAKMQIAGVILGNVNMFVGLQIFFTSFGLGFHRKDGVDMLVLCANTALTMVNTFFNIFTNALVVFSMNDMGFGPEIFLKIDSIVAIGTEESLASSIYNMMMPGSFFVGYLMCIVMAGVVPFIWNSFLMKVIYVWKCLPNPLLNILKAILPWAGDLDLDHYPYRRAERGFEPMEISIGGDYTAMIVNPSVCFCMLFFVSPYVWRTFQMLFFSTIFQYMFSRYMHLRFCKACFYTTNRLDTVVNFLWGIPLSIIAAAWCTWGIRSEYIAFEASLPVKFGLVVAAFFASFALWVASYQMIVKPFEQRNVPEEDLSSFHDVKSDVLYSWFNCNPIYVLKCEYFYQDKRTACSIVRKPGTLKVNVIKASGLRGAGWAPKRGVLTEARVTCELVGKPDLRVETHACQDMVNTEWDFSGEIAHYCDGDSVLITLTDTDPVRGERHGTATLTAEQVRYGFRGEVELDIGASGAKAKVMLCVEPPEKDVSLTKVSIKSAKGLGNADWIPGFRSADPYVVCSVEGRPGNRLVTSKKSNSSDPVWNFASGLDLDEGDNLVFTVLDHDTFSHDDFLGVAKLPSREVRQGFAGELKLERNGKPTKATLTVRVEPPQDGVRTASSSRRGHPLACGEDPDQVRFFEVGKEYLFLAPEKQALVHRELRSQTELETWLEHILAVFGTFISLFVSAAKEQVDEAQRQVNEAQIQMREQLDKLPKLDSVPLLKELKSSDRLLGNILTGESPNCRHAMSP